MLSQNVSTSEVERLEFLANEAKGQVEDKPHH